MSEKIRALVEPVPETGLIPGYEHLGRVQGSPIVVRLAPEMPPFQVIYRCEKGEVAVPCMAGKEHSAIVLPGSTIRK